MPGESWRVLFLKLVVRQIVWLSLIKSFIKTNNSLLLKSSVVPTITGFFISRMCNKDTYLQSNLTGLKKRNTNQNIIFIVLNAWKKIYPYLCFCDKLYFNSNLVTWSIKMVLDASVFDGDCIPMLGLQISYILRQRELNRLFSSLWLSGDKHCKKGLVAKCLVT